MAVSEHSLVSMTDSIVELNVAGGRGGAVSLSAGAILTSHGPSSQFSGNTCGEYGGAFYMSASNYSTDSGDAFLDNKAQTAGGALFWSWDSMDMVSDENFWRGWHKRNHAPDGPNASTPTRYIVAEHANFNETSSTANFKRPVYVYAYDVYGQLVTQISDKVTLSCSTAVTTDDEAARRLTGFTASMSGTVELALTNGSAMFDEIAVTLEPNRRIEIDASLTFVTPGGDTLTLETSAAVYLQSCIDGEEEITQTSGRTVCNLCDSGNTEFSFESKAACQDCPSHASCRGTNITVEKDYWRAGAESTIVRKCSLLDACKGGADTAVDHQCRDGHTGPMCGQCRAGYTLDDLRGNCKWCGTGGGADAGTLLLLLALGAVLLVFGILWRYRKKIGNFLHANFSFLQKMRENMSKYRVKAKILITFFQIVSQYVGGCISPPWPKAYANIARKFDVRRVAESAPPPALPPIEPFLSACSSPS